MPRVATIKRVTTEGDGLSGASINDKSEVFFDTFLADGTDVLLVASPSR